MRAATERPKIAFMFVMKSLARKVIAFESFSFVSAVAGLWAGHWCLTTDTGFRHRGAFAEGLPVWVVGVVSIAVGATLLWRFFADRASRGEVR